MMDEEKFLNDIWSLRYHDSSSSDWTTTSYIHLKDISSVQDVNSMLASMSPYLTHGMFFIMREHVFPSWDDPCNIDGGCISFKIPDEHIKNYWKRLIQLALGESYDCMTNVTGVSISPKRNFSIVKIWLSTDSSNTFLSKNELLPDYDGEMVFKLNRESIAINNNTQ